jgi:hypothetical protein
MKVQLSDGRLAKIGVKFGTDVPNLPEDRPEPYTEKELDRFRSVSMKLTVFKDGVEVGTVTGTSYCSPRDRFEKAKGRQIAMRRLLQSDNAGSNLLSKEDRKVLCPVLLTGRNSVPYRPEIPNLEDLDLYGDAEKRFSQFRKRGGKIMPAEEQVKP